MRFVVLPQAIKNVLPALANEIVTMVKESSICSMLGMEELMFGAKAVASATSRLPRALYPRGPDLFLHQLPRQQGHRGRRKGGCAVATSNNELIRVEHVVRNSTAAPSRP